MLTMIGAAAPALLPAPSLAERAKSLSDSATKMRAEAVKLQIQGRTAEANAALAQAKMFESMAVDIGKQAAAQAASGAVASAAARGRTPEEAAAIAKAASASGAPAAAAADAVSDLPTSVQAQILPGNKKLWIAMGIMAAVGAGWHFYKKSH